MGTDRARVDQPCTRGGRAANAQRAAAGGIASRRRQPGQARPGTGYRARPGSDHGRPLGPGMPGAGTGGAGQLARRLPPRDKPRWGARLDRPAGRKVTLRMELLRRRRRAARGRVSPPWGRILDRHYRARLPARRHRPRRLASQPPAQIRSRSAASRSEPGCSSRRPATCSSSGPGV